MAKNQSNRTSRSLRSFSIRFVMVLVILLIAYSACAIVQAQAGGYETSTKYSASKNSAVFTVYVEQGDTLWTIARAHAPRGTDVRTYIDQIKHVNHLKNEMLKEGQSLLLP